MRPVYQRKGAGKHIYEDMLSNHLGWSVGLQQHVGFALVKGTGSLYHRVVVDLHLSAVVVVRQVSQLRPGTDT